jgi:hypothetical protein
VRKLYHNTGKPEHLPDLTFTVQDEKETEALNAAQAAALKAYLVRAAAGFAVIAAARRATREWDYTKIIMAMGGALLGLCANIRKSAVHS